MAGVQKAGTTSLFSHLASHPQLEPPDRKELHFFDGEERDWSQPDYDPLHAGFSPDGEGLRFEATPIYLFWPRAMARIRRYNRDIRLIVLFRDPVARAYSHWRMETRRGDETRSFGTAIRAELLEGLENERSLRHHSYVSRGFYGRQMREALKLFDRDQWLMLDAAELFAAPERTLARIAGFLGIGGFGATEARHDNAGGERQAVPEPEADILRALYRDDLERLAGLGGPDLRAR